MRSFSTELGSSVFRCDTEEHLKWAFWGSGDALWDWDLDQQVVYRRGFAERLGLDTAAVQPAEDGMLSLIHPEDRAGYLEAVARFKAGLDAVFCVEYRLRTRSGTWLWVFDRGKVVTHNGHGAPHRAAGICRDISALKEREAAFRLADRVIHCMHEAVFITTLDRAVVSTNRAFDTVMAYPPGAVTGRPAAALYSPRHPDNFYEELFAKAISRGNWHGEVWLRPREGADKLTWLELSLVSDEQGRQSHLVGVFTDVTERKKVEEKLWYLANYDLLTGLPSRGLFHERLKHALRHARRAEHRVALMFLDLDHFKDINDSMGHQAGDELLQLVAARLREVVRDADTVARLGGDEFTIILENVAGRRAARGLCRKITEALCEPFVVQDQEVCISASVGVGMFPDDAAGADDLVKHADAAMYHAKALGRHCFQFYDAHINRHEVNRLQMLSLLRRALARDELFLVYQPKRSLRTDAITGLEALLRWQSAELGLVTPDTFIPVAEDAGLIVPIGEWVLREACRQAVAWRGMGLTPLTMSVNLSAVQFLRADMPALVADILAETGMRGEELELELTESLLMKDTGRTKAMLRDLKTLGVRVALDDFGTGYSSLSYLTRFPIDTLKIDKAFIANITTEPSDAAIAGAIIAMAHALNLNIIAEGVETAPQRAHLAAEGCDELQGYLFSKPLDSAACTRFLQSRGPRSA